MRLRIWRAIYIFSRRRYMAAIAAYLRKAGLSDHRVASAPYTEIPNIH